MAIVSDRVVILAPCDDGSVYGDVTVIRNVDGTGGVAISRQLLPELLRHLQIINAGQQSGQRIKIEAK